MVKNTYPDGTELEQRHNCNFSHMPNSAYSLKFTRKC